jgi:hypothetical protein
MKKTSLSKKTGSVEPVAEMIVELGFLVSEAETEIQLKSFSATRRDLHFTIWQLPAN